MWKKKEFSDGFNPGRLIYTLDSKLSEQPEVSSAKISIVNSVPESMIEGIQLETSFQSKIRVGEVEYSLSMYFYV